MMSTDKQREAFERWAAGVAYLPHLDVLEDCRYHAIATQGAWLAWQAARRVLIESMETIVHLEMYPEGAEFFQCPEISKVPCGSHALAIIPEVGK